MIEKRRMEKQTGGANYGQGKRKKKLGIITEFHNLKSLREKRGDKFLHNPNSILEKTFTMPSKLVKNSTMLPKQALGQVLNECFLPYGYTDQNSTHRSEYLNRKLKVISKEPTSEEGHCDHELADITEASAMPETSTRSKAKCVFDGLGNGDTQCLIHRSVEQLLCEQNAVQDIPSRESQGNVTKSFKRDYFGVKGKATKELSGDFDSFGCLNSHVMGINCESRSLRAQVHLTRQVLCCKCREGGQVLNCNINGCPIVIHESCLGPLENTSNFICILCSYEKASVAYKKAKRNLKEARKGLRTFVEDSEIYKKKKEPCVIKVRITHSDLPSVSHDRSVNDNVSSHQAFDDTNRRGKRNVGEEQNCIGEEEMETCLYKNNVFNGSKEGEFCGVQLHAKLTKIQQHEIVFHEHNIEQGRRSPQIDDGLLLSKNIMPFHSHLVVEGKSGKSQSEMDKDHEHECDEVVEHCEAARSHEKTENSKFSHEMDTPHMENHARREKRKREFCANKHKENVSPKKDKKHKLRRKQNSNPDLAFCLRRRPLKWSEKEVEILKEAVEKIPANSDGSFAWTKIYDYGRHAFNKKRTPIDLKDKWRNILSSRASEES